VRKPKPTKIYREEVFYSDGTPGATRQSFDEKQYLAWQEYVQRFPSKVRKARFFVGEITWTEVD
jgi:hypothetical protein